MITVTLAEKRHYIESIVRRVYLNHVKPGNGYGNINYHKNDYMLLVGKFDEMKLDRDDLLPISYNYGISWCKVILPQEDNRVVVTSLEEGIPVPINVNSYINYDRGHYSAKQVVPGALIWCYDLYEVLVAHILKPGKDGEELRKFIDLIALIGEYDSVWKKEIFFMLAVNNRLGYPHHQPHQPYSGHMGGAGTFTHPRGYGRP